MTTQWTVPKVSGEPLTIDLQVGEKLFIVGPNGSGKSALIQHAVNHFGSGNVRRISAHRQTWLESGNIDMTPQSRRQFDDQLRGQERNHVYRWREWNSPGRLSSVLFDLTAAENDLARRIMDRAYARDHQSVDHIVNSERPVFARVNDLLALAGLAVTIENSSGEEILARHQDASTPYSIAQMSDGERNAVIIAANVLTVDAGTILLIDEPERHLHRSIIEPFLSALFAQRPDCPFLVSTHEIGLPMGNPESMVIVVRSCQWNGVVPKAWDVQLLSRNDRLPEDLKRAILGTRNRILFVEGEPQSLDSLLYRALFPAVSVTPVGTCHDVIQAVKGLRDSLELHDVSAFGLIDRDNRSNDDVTAMEKDRIFALTTYSVESLYYCKAAMKAVSNWQAESLSHDANQMIIDAQSKASMALREPGLRERMAAIRCEQLARSRLRLKLPTWEDILDNPDQTITMEIKSVYQDELALFQKLLDDGDFDEIAARYPIRRSKVLSQIAGAFYLSKDNYERTVVSRVRNDDVLASKLRQRLEPLSGYIMAEP